MIYKFTISYQTPTQKDVSNFMKCVDLDHGDICVQQTLTFSAKDRPIEEVQSLLKNALEVTGNKVFSIKGEKMHSSPKLS